jgi:hypothetical protein
MKMKKLILAALFFFFGFRNMLLSSLRKVEAKQQRLIILTVLMMELVMLKRGFHVLLNVIMELFNCLSIYQHNLQETLFIFVLQANKPAVSID